MAISRNGQDAIKENVEASFPARPAPEPASYLTEGSKTTRALVSGPARSSSARKALALRPHPALRVEGPQAAATWVQTDQSTIPDIGLKNSSRSVKGVAPTPPQRAPIHHRRRRVLHGDDIPRFMKARRGRRELGTPLRRHPRMRRDRPQTTLRRGHQRGSRHHQKPRVHARDAPSTTNSSPRPPGEKTPQRSPTAASSCD